MNKNIEVIRISNVKALDMSVDAFLDWYFRGRENDLIDEGTKGHMKMILKELQQSEIGELVSFAHLDTSDFKPIYSNIHKKASRAPATSVDIITKKDGCYYFTEVKTPTNPTHSNINSNINKASDEIVGRKENISDAIMWTGLNIPKNELVESLWGGVVCLVTGSKNAEDDYADKEYPTFIIFIEDFDKIKDIDINKDLLEIIDE